MAFLIDKYLPRFIYNEYHEKSIKATPEICFLATKNLDISKSSISLFLMKLRGLPTTFIGF